MMKWGIIGCLGVAFVVTTAGAKAASAADDDASPPGWFGDFHPEVAGRLTLGPLGDSPGPTPLVGGGAGIRGGLSYGGLYGGLTYMDYFTNSGCTDGGAQSCGSTHGSSFGVEAGYGITFFRMLLARAELGLGNYRLDNKGSITTCDFACTTSTTTTTSSSSNTPYLQPGILLALQLGPVLVGADASVFFMPSAPFATPIGGPFAAFMVGAQLGVRL
jgi:hypothetical protein